MKLKDLFATHLLALVLVALISIPFHDIQTPYGDYVVFLLFGAIAVLCFDLSVVLWKMIDHLDE